MNRTEAIKLLEGVKTITEVTIDEMAALNFAIEILKELTVSEDCISRQRGEADQLKVYEAGYKQGRFDESADREYGMGTDCISRQQVIEAVHKYFVDALDKTPHEIDEDGDDVYTDTEVVNELLKHNKHISKAIKTLPPNHTTSQGTTSRHSNYSHRPAGFCTGQREEYI